MEITMLEESPVFGFNVIGYSSNSGMGNTFRQYINALITRGENVLVLDLSVNSSRIESDNSLDKLFVSSASELTYAINLFLIGSVDLPYFSLSPPDGLCIKDRLNVAFVWWELDHLPQYWIDAAKVFDVLIAGSEFVYSALSNNISGVPVLHAPHPISIPNDIQSNRRRFQLPEQDFIVYMGFDPISGIDRKNPFSAIEAFKQAFSNRSDCHLVIKVNYSNKISDELAANLKHLFVCIGSDTRIHLIQDSLTYSELLCLYASCDVFISLHRSEGLGLIPLEAMRLGKPVIATAWSGNMSYMNYSNACLVEFDFVPIAANCQHYGSISLGIECKWAEPNILQAAAWMRKLAEDTEFLLQLGLKASTDAVLYQEQASKAGFVDELNGIWENRDFLPKRNRESLVSQARESQKKFEYQKYLHKMSPFERFVHEIRVSLDCHLLWRFSKAEV